MSTGEESMIHEPDLNAVPEKPALVTEKTKSKKKKNEKITLTWDENAIEEHDQLRGTRMKIDEPDTPFYYHSDSEASCGSHQSKEQAAGLSKQLNWTHLETKLGAVAAAREACPSSPSVGSHGGSSGVDSDFELDQKRKKAKAKEFDMHRKKHYNEMELVKKWRAEHQNDDDDDDDDDDE